MPASETPFTAIAAECFVAHKIALLGFIPAVVRRGTHAADLFAATHDGAKAIPVQVEAAVNATRHALSDIAGRVLQFPLSRRSVACASEHTIFCFVNLRSHLGGAPEVFVLSGAELRRQQVGQRSSPYSSFAYINSSAALAPFRDNWQPLITALAGPATEPFLVSHLPNPRVATGTDSFDS